MRQKPVVCPGAYATASPAQPSAKIKRKSKALFRRLFLAARTHPGLEINTVLGIARCGLMKSLIVSNPRA
jgi:hypothetical protein